MSAFGDFRAAVAAALDLDPDWSVHPTPVDALSPPAFILAWSDPWGLEPATYCDYAVELLVYVVAGRTDPDPGLETIEAMMSAALDALGTNGLRPRTWTAPRPFPIGGVSYLAALLTIPTTLTFGGT